MAAPPTDLTDLVMRLSSCVAEIDAMCDECLDWEDRVGATGEEAPPFYGAVRPHLHTLRDVSFYLEFVIDMIPCPRPP